MTKKKQKKKQYHLIIICFALSVLSWFAVKMSKNYTQPYQFAVDFINLPKDKVIAYQSDTNITVTISAKGVSLLKYEFSRKKIQVDYTSIATAEQKRRNYITIKKNQLNTYLIKQQDFPESSVINDPSSITLELEAAPQQ